MFMCFIQSHLITALTYLIFKILIVKYTEHKSCHLLWLFLKRHLFQDADKSLRFHLCYLWRMLVQLALQI